MCPHHYLLCEQCRTRLKLITPLEAQIIIPVKQQIVLRTGTPHLFFFVEKLYKHTLMEEMI